MIALEGTQFIVVFDIKTRIMTDVYISNFDMGGGGEEVIWNILHPNQFPFWLVYDFEVFEMHLIFWKGDG